LGYSVKEIFYTLQGEGVNTGRPAVFCRFAGCNLWSGFERDRAEAVCKFCDTDFIGSDGQHGGKYPDAQSLARAISNVAPVARDERLLVVLTGGEPALQLDTALIGALHDAGFEIAIETNGTLPLPHGLDWVCVSPKAGTTLAVTAGDELKLVFPQDGVVPEQFENLAFQYFMLQPMDGPEVDRFTQLAIEYCRHHPHWRLSLQTHKLLGIP
jgi:7-carboxy-7-deazaguanine synthase (Cx14CxxC type)